jgi:hypothetical protein
VSVVVADAVAAAVLVAGGVGLAAGDWLGHALALRVGAVEAVVDPEVVKVECTPKTS